VTSQRANVTLAAASIADLARSHAIVVTRGRRYAIVVTRRYWPQLGLPALQAWL
jgi:hypothetical protein